MIFSRSSKSGIQSTRKVVIFTAIQALCVLLAGLLVFMAYRDHRIHFAVNEAHTHAGGHSDTLIYALGLMLAAFVCVVAVILPLMRKTENEAEGISNLAKSYEKQAVTDVLTELPNRRFFENAFTAYLSEFNNMDQSVGLLVLDLDRFKSVNDNYGHDIGDLVLREVALRLSAITREHDVVARLGGEEFAVIAPFANDDHLMAIAERYRSQIESLKVDIGSVVLRPTVSIGVATNAQRNNDIHEMFKHADAKLYEAKRGGRNRVAA